MKQKYYFTIMKVCKKHESIVYLKAFANRYHLSHHKKLQHSNTPIAWAVRHTAKSLVERIFWTGTWKDFECAKRTLYVVFVKMITKLCGGWLGILSKNAIKISFAVDLEKFKNKKDICMAWANVAVAMMVNIIFDEPNSVF